MEKNNVNIKQKIIKALKLKRKFCIRWGETLWYEKGVEAVDKEDAEQMFNNGEVNVGENDIVDSDFLEDSFEVEEA